MLLCSWETCQKCIARPSVRFRYLIDNLVNFKQKVYENDLDKRFLED